MNTSSKRRERGHEAGASSSADLVCGQADPVGVPNQAAAGQAAFAVDRFSHEATGYAAGA
ncbi:MAG: hypothetical protein FJ312_01660 [SAR202 cluster bacterium]|nr:hypothetical protein [SAR202 cluster bacterium]